MTIRTVTRALLGTLASVLMVVACRDLVAPDRGTSNVDQSAALINLSGRVVVHPGDMHGWVFYNDQTGAVCAGSACRMVAGPAGQPGGAGSAELADSLPTDGKALILPDYKGVRFDRLTTLRYSTYRQTTNPGNNLAIALQFNVDYDLNDSSTGYQGRLVFEPYVGIGGNVPAQTWQSWDAKAGRWWGSRTTVTVNNANVTNTCVQATPCTWTQLLAAFARVGVHNVYGAVVLKAGSGWTNFRGNVDKLVIGVDSAVTTFDFELLAPADVPAAAPDSLPADYETMADTINGGEHFAGTVLRSIVVVQFKENTTQADKQLAIEGVAGIVVGGRSHVVREGIYLVRVPTDGTSAQLFAAIDQLRQHPRVAFVSSEEVLSDFTTYRLSTDGNAVAGGPWRLDPDSAFGNASRRRWPLEAINAPFAWGCSTGGTTRVGVLDMDVHAEGEVVVNLDTIFEGRASHTDEHGTHMASIIAARANDTSGTTGVMWNAKLSMADISLFNAAGQPVLDQYGRRLSNTSATVLMLQSLALRGARVINLSVGSSSLVVVSGPHTALQDEKRAQWGAVIRGAADFAPTPALSPLFVISAGNMRNGTDIYWNAITGGADSLPSGVLIVAGAAADSGALLPASTGQGAIDLVAPGHNVAVSGLAGVTTVSGSSPATALVTGAAGLLFSFDSTLTAAEVREFLRQGAVAGGRQAGGYPMLDVYESLRKASGRGPGAPLCGVRTWGNDQGDLMAQRTAGPAVVLPHGSDPFDATYVNIHHGGKRIERAFGERFLWSATGWTSGDWNPDNTGEYSASFKSSGAWFQDHDDLINSQVIRTLLSGGVRIDVTTYPTAGGTPIQVPSATVPITLLAAIDSMCAREALDSVQGPAQYRCTATADTGRRVLLRDIPQSGTDPNALHALDPQRRFVVVPLVTRRTTFQLSQAWTPCAGPDGARFPSIRCRSGLYDSLTTDGAQLIRVDLTTGQTTTWQLPSSGGALPLEPSWLAIADDSREIILQVAGYRIGSGTASCENPRHLWLTMTSTAGTLSSAFTVPLSGSRLCDGSLDGSASLRVQSLRQLRSP